MISGGQQSSRAERRRRATAQMVAEAAQVSRAAVSRAFNPEASLAPEKRQLILQIARELNYVPDRAARMLKTQRSHLVSLIVPGICSPWEAQEIDALTSELQHHGFAAVLFKTHAKLEMDEAALRSMRAFNPDSVIVFPEYVRPDRIAPFLDRAVPIYIDNGTGFGSQASSLLDRLEIDQRPGMEQAVALVGGFGLRRSCYISGRLESEGEIARRAALTAALEHQGLPPPRVVTGDFTYASGHRAALEIFSVQDGTDVIFAANDESAFGAMDAIRHRLRMRIPEDVSVVGFDDIAQSGWDSYNLTTIKIELSARVQALVRLIQRRLRAPDAGQLSEHQSTRLVVRGTVGARGA